MDNTFPDVEHVLVKDLRPGIEIVQFFQLSSKELRKTKTGQDYLSLILSDMSGSLPAKLWSNSMKSSRLDFEIGDFVKTKGMTERYGDSLQMNIDRIRKADISEISDLDSLIRKTSFDIEILYKDILHTAELLSPPQLSELVKKVIEEHSERFRTYPAARRIHHAYFGGFIEHTYTVMTKVQAMIGLIPAINADLALAGAILHDIGKLSELDPVSKGRTIAGRLKGHVMLGIEVLRDAACQLNVVSAPWLYELEHILLSHHGELEFGALVKPLTREALLVHFIDNLDSKLKIIDEALERTGPEGFSDYNRYLEGRAYAGSHRLTED